MVGRLTIFLVAIERGCGLPAADRAAGLVAARLLCVLCLQTREGGEEALTEFRWLLVRLWLRLVLILLG